MGLRVWAVVLDLVVVGCLLVLVVNSVVYFNFFLLIYSVVVSLAVGFIVFV